MSFVFPIAFSFVSSIHPLLVLCKIYFPLTTWIDVKTVNDVNFDSHPISLHHSVSLLGNNLYILSKGFTQGCLPMLTLLLPTVASSWLEVDLYSKCSISSRRCSIGLKSCDWALRWIYCHVHGAFPGQFCSCGMGHYPAGKILPQQCLHAVRDAPDWQ